MLWLWIGIVLGAALLVWMIVEAYQTNVVVEEIKLKRLPESFDGTRLFFISDIHRRRVTDELIGKVAAAGGADLVLVGGDLTERGVPLQRTRQNLRKLAGIAPVYAVYGNHDYDGDSRKLEVLLREEGVHVLVNENVLLEQADGSEVLLCGVDDPITERDRLKLALDVEDRWMAKSGPENNRFTILLSHDPLIAKRLDGAPIDLILSGHTHGGQIALPVIGPILRSPSVISFCRGWYQLQSQQKTTGLLTTRLFVSCGYGTSKVPMRLNAPSETHLFILRSKDQRVQAQ